jgi:putative ABC transport system ATP-binding protein
MSEEVIVSARNIQKWFRTGKIEVHALRDVSIDVRKGEMLAIMGPSGCGKTTLLNALSGLDDFDAGEVMIEGQKLNAMNDQKRTRYRAERMGFIFQSYNLLPVITAVENVELPLLVSGMHPTLARKTAMTTLDAVGIADRAGHRPAELSGGQRQRVTIARALVNRPAIVWADEPTGSLDSKASTEILDLLRELNRSHGQTIVMVTHDIAIGRSLDRLVNMKDGAITSVVAQGEFRPAAQPAWA